MKYYKTIKPWALVAACVVAGFFVVSQKALSDTETVTTYDYGTQSFRTETIRRDGGRVDVRGFDYGTGDHYQYQGDSDGGQGYSYGSGTFTTTDGNPYGVSE